ncbi:MAG: endolytic transglycosylase MltG [Spirochaetota bacterium]
MRLRIIFPSLALAAFFAGLLLVTLFRPPVRDASSARIVIPPGASASKVSEILSENKLITSPLLFRTALRILGKERSIKAGTYRIQGNTRLGELIRILSEGRVSSVKVTIPEGATLSRIGRILDQAGVVRIEDFTAAVTDVRLAQEMGIPSQGFEGFLFPDTYEFPEGASAEEVLGRMTDNFFDRLASLGWPSGKTPQDLLSLVTLASIVEREFRKPEEAPLMASVFANRLGLGMPLQSCATVVYIITEKLGKPHPKVVYFSDLEIKDPYNTYRVRGLPPGPISNPGIVSLKAAMDPPKSKYLYFRLEDADAGSHRFSSSFDEHRQDSIPVKGY